MTGPDVSAVRTAARELELAVDQLRRHHGDSVDLRRLATDAARIQEDLDLLTGHPGPASGPPPGEPVVVSDEDYPPEFWADASDEGIGRQ